MLYKQLQRFNELDKQIHDMHQKLAEYYRERAELTAADNTAATAATIRTKTVHTPSIDELYTNLQQVWQPHGIKLPTRATLQKKLTKARSIMEDLLVDNPQLTGKLHVIAIPPQNQLEKLLTHPNPLASRYVFTEDYHANISLRSSVWSIIVITGQEFSLPIDKLSDSLGKDELTYKTYDCRALGVRETIAADIQGIPVVTDNNWTLLLKDAKTADYIPCVTKQENQLVFEIEDARGLLGNNYVQPAIAAK